MVSIVLFLTLATDILPFWYAARSHRQTTLYHAIFWALAAWICWMAACLGENAQEAEPLLYRYMALGSTGCASIAVLGARRPGVGAWNFVILGLLAVMMFLWLEGRWAPDDVILRRMRIVFLASTIAIGVLNYLPTRLAPAAMLLGFACGLEMFLMAGSVVEHFETTQLLAGFTLASVPWVAYARMRWQPLAPSEFDQVWLRFRDSFGLVWAQRLREQFNLSAKHSNWPVILRWQGLRVIPGEASPTNEDRQTMVANLRALMKRFEAPESQKTTDQ